MNAQGTNSTYIKGNRIVSVMYFTHFRPKSLLTMLWKHPGEAEQDQRCVMDHFHASRSLFSAKAAAQVCAHATTDHGVLLGCSLVQAEGDRECLPPSLLLLSDTGDTGITAKSPSPLQNGGFCQGHSFKDNT